jgi:hypothetical protein
MAIKPMTANCTGKNDKLMQIIPATIHNAFVPSAPRFLNLHGFEIEVCVPVKIRMHFHLAFIFFNQDSNSILNAGFFTFMVS